MLCSLQMRKIPRNHSGHASQSGRWWSSIFWLLYLNALTNFCSLECSNNFVCNMLRLGMYIQFVWKKFKFLAFSHFQMLNMLCRGMTNQFQFWECSILFECSKVFQFFWLKGETILSHGVLEVVATRHRLRRLWGQIVIPILKSNQIYTNFVIGYFWLKDRIRT